MRKIYLMPLVVSVFMLTRCATQQKIEYNIPENMTEQQKVELRANLDKGMVLYKLNCAACHGIFKKGKDTIANFSVQQFNAYKAGHALHDPRNHAFAQKMSAEDLNNTIRFLQLRKRQVAMK